VYLVTSALSFAHIVGIAFAVSSTCVNTEQSQTAQETPPPTSTSAVLWSCTAKAQHSVRSSARTRGRSPAAGGEEYPRHLHSVAL